MDSWWVSVEVLVESVGRRGGHTCVVKVWEAQKLRAKSALTVCSGVCMSFCSTYAATRLNVLTSLGNPFSRIVPSMMPLFLRPFKRGRGGG